MPHCHCRGTLEKTATSLTNTFEDMQRPNGTGDQAPPNRLGYLGSDGRNHHPSYYAAAERANQAAAGYGGYPSYPPGGPTYGQYAGQPGVGTPRYYGNEGYTGQPAAGAGFSGVANSGAGFAGQPAASSAGYYGQPAATGGYYGQPNPGSGGFYGQQPASGGYFSQPLPPPPPSVQLALDREHQARMMAMLRAAFPDVQDAVLATSLRVRKTYEAAAAWLREMQARGNLPGQQQQQLRQQIMRPAKTIRQKFSHTAGVAPGMPLQMPMPPMPYPTAMPRQEQPVLTRKYRKYDEDEFSASDESGGENYDPQSAREFEERVLRFLNTAPVPAIIDVSACTQEMAEALVKKRPYGSLFQAQKVDIPSQQPKQEPQKRKRGAVKKAAGTKIVEAALSTLRGYEAVDSLIQQCANLGKRVHAGIHEWGIDIRGDSELGVTEVAGGNGFFKEKPALLAPDVELKPYQQVGINWLALLYRMRMSCILADEMGLGKTCQVIAFLAHLKEKGERSPHLVVCPSSTLENWLREFARFCPSLVVEPYYGSQSERADIRETILANGANFDVLVTTYNLATGGKQDMGFLKSLKFNVCIYDEGHLLKNSQSERYNKLMRLRANFRVLLTGTPLQNNLRELVSLLSFILPGLFEANREELLEVFKFKAKTTSSDTREGSPDPERSLLLSEQRIIKAKTMMAPFVLRRRKEQVLQHLPPKSHEVAKCAMTEDQAKLYKEELSHNRGSIREAADNAVHEQIQGGRKARQAGQALDNVLMQLRKAALHPLLFRRHYNDDLVKQMASEIMQEEQYKSANEQYIIEDMQVMNDFELNNLCTKFSLTIGQHALPGSAFLNSGKILKLQSLLKDMQQRNDRILIFSQFTQILDILEKVLGMIGMKFLRMDGQTPVDVRQDMIDRFHEEEEVSAFLLSTKAGGFGINLACANVVIVFDLSFNPHDDKQAEDRAHRVGQTRPVRVIRLITEHTIEESILTLANTKLALDKHVSEENDEIDAEAEGLVATWVLDQKTPEPAGIPAPKDVPSSTKKEDSEPAEVVKQESVKDEPAQEQSPKDKSAQGESVQDVTVQEDAAKKEPDTEIPAKEEHSPVEPKVESATEESNAPASAPQQAPPAVPTGQEKPPPHTQTEPLPHDDDAEDNAEDFEDELEEEYDEDSDEDFEDYSD